MPRKLKKPYKDPVFLFTSCSLRFAAWAGWYSAFGDKENAEHWVHQAYEEWIKELGAGRRFDFLRRHNHDIWDKIPPGRLKEMVDDFLGSVKKEIRGSKYSRRKLFLTLPDKSL